MDHQVKESERDQNLLEAVTQKLSLLQMALDASSQGLLITDGTGRVLYHNQRLLRMLEIPDDAVALNNDYWKVSICRRMKDQERMFRTLNEIESQRAVETLDVFELADGRLVECHTRYQEAEPPGSVCRLWTLQDCTEQQRRERELQHLSTHDTLTGMNNRTFFDSKLNQLRYSSCFPLCMIMVDIDGLKKINDYCGHPAGDDLLRFAAKILRQACRSEDVVARIGGDEFGLLLLRAGSEVAEQVTDRIFGLLNLHNIRHPEIQISLSLGYAVASNNREVETLFARADETMYESRRKRREQV